LYCNSVGIVEKKIFKSEKPLKLVSGIELNPIHIAYETYGTLNEDKSNVILLLHALSGNQHAAGFHEGDSKPGWWEEMVGPGKPFDTNRYFIICSNIIGSCYGSTGPASLNPQTGKSFGLDFPVITVKDMVKAQKMLLDHLGIKQLFSIAGGSLGGMQALEWAITYPEMVKSAIVIAATSKMSTQNMGFHEIGRFAILSDPNFHNGNYYSEPHGPDKGLALARMVGHITYLSEEAMNSKFGRQLKTGRYMFDLKHIEFQVQSYLHYQGSKFVRRFDANSYLYITKAMDYFDVTDILQKIKINTRFLVIGFTSDWLFPISQSMEIVDALRSNKNHVSYASIDSTEGHDSFLLNFEKQAEVVSSFLKGCGNA
jgi:homoserine O-acetyltransferase